MADEKEIQGGGTEEIKDVSGGKDKPEVSPPVSEIQQKKEDEIVSTLSDDKESNELSDRDLKMIVQQLKMETYFWKNPRIKQIAKQRKMDAKDLLQQLRNFEKNRIRNNEKGRLRHYHRTRLDLFKSIVEEKSLLSIAKLSERRPDIEIPKGSTNPEVMFTRDRYNSEGRFINSGFEADRSVGAAGSDIVFVFDDTIMGLDDYDSLLTYPTVTEVSLEDYCEVILVKDAETLKLVKQLLSDNGLEIPVSLMREWKRN